MIGVAANSADVRAVTEFFELFKTPWEWLVPGKRYDVVLSADGHTEPGDAALALVYGAGQHAVDRRLGIFTEVTRGPADVVWGDSTLPVYQGVATFRGEIGSGLLFARGRSMDYRAALGATTVRRFGYDLFTEASNLLAQGQPKSHAHIATLERHIELIRHCLSESAISYVEVPPRPHRADFVCCLTHDVDFFGIRRHATPRTLAGFIVRGTVGTLLEVLLGRRPLAEAARNWQAVISLPLVLVGLTKDPWNPFRDYAEADRGHRATFFLVPFSNRPGAMPDGTVQARRSVAYGIRDVRAEIQNIATTPTEFGVHGIDAWRDAEAAREEMAELTNVTSQQRAGVRMHWLYFSDESPRYLEDGGFDYDSTCGYNDAVGFRAGTLQAFPLPGTEHLMELPLAIMDTAMFYADRMGLTRAEARDRCAAIVREARRFGGALVINWHDRSLAPERQWRRCYDELLNDLESGAVWFATAGEAVDWFRWRRSIRFVTDAASADVTVQAPALPEHLPAARLVMRRDSEVEESEFRGETRTVRFSSTRQPVALSR
jgi:hypothetical protein